MHLTKKIILDSNQMNKLIEEKSIFLSENEILQVHNGKLVLNTNGYIHYTNEISMQFNQYRIENKFIINDIKQLVCNHLNLQSSEVIYLSGGGSLYDFIIKFDGKNEWRITVCDFNTAVDNMNQLSDEEFIADYNAEVIGLYRRLGSSPYYFRWFDMVY